MHFEYAGKRQLQASIFLKCQSSHHVGVISEETGIVQQANYKLPTSHGFQPKTTWEPTKKCQFCFSNKAAQNCLNVVCVCIPTYVLLICFKT